MLITLIRNCDRVKMGVPRAARECYRADHDCERRRILAANDLLSVCPGVQIRARRRARPSSTRRPRYDTKDLWPDTVSSTQSRRSNLDDESLTIFAASQRGSLEESFWSSKVTLRVVCANTGSSNTSVLSHPDPKAVEHA